MKITLKHDSRDFHFYKQFGAVEDLSTIPDEFNFDSSMPDFVQPVGNYECTAITVCDIANDQDKTEYDFDDLFNRVPHEKYGADPRLVMQEAVNNGLLIKGSSLPRVKHWTGYWRGDTGNKDPFDNMISALWIAQCPFGVYSNWYAEWAVGENGIMPIGKIITSAHMYDINGVKIVNGEKMFVIQSWLGYTTYMPRETFNKAVTEWGCGSGVISNAEIDERKKQVQISLIRKLLDLCINLLLLYKQGNFGYPPDTTREKLYLEAKNYLGKTLVPVGDDPDVGCAISLSNLLNLSGIKVQKTLSTWLLLQNFISDTVHFKEIKESEAIFGDIIISATGTSTKKNPQIKHGHCGVVAKYGILSNSSLTGLWSENFTLQSWKKRYEIQGGYPTRFFRAL